MSFSENKHMNDDEFVLQLFKIIEKKVDMLPDTYVKKSYAEDIMQHCFVRLWQNHKTGVLDKNFWAFVAYITAYGRSTYIIVIGLKMKFYAGKCPKIFRHVQFGRKMLLYPKISFTSNGSIYVLIRRREAVKHRISCLRYTVENRYQRRRANWRFRMPRLTEFFAVLPAVFIAANVRGDKSPVIPRAAHFAPPAVFKLKFGSASSYEKAGRLL